MEKKLVGLYVPAAQERFDILVPMDVAIGELAVLVTNGAAELCGGRYVPSREEVLTMRQPDMLLDPEKTLADYGVEDGAQLVLI